MKRFRELTSLLKTAVTGIGLKEDTLSSRRPLNRTTSSVVAQEEKEEEEEEQKKQGKEEEGHGEEEVFSPKVIIFFK
jgi:hypothetical protein